MLSQPPASPGQHDTRMAAKEATVAPWDHQAGAGRLESSSQLVMWVRPHSCPQLPQNLGCADPARASPADPGQGSAHLSLFQCPVGTRVRAVPGPPTWPHMGDRGECVGGRERPPRWRTAPPQPVHDSWLFPPTLCPSLVFPGWHPHPPSVPATAPPASFLTCGL